jgi:hypothetical protein
MFDEDTLTATEMVEVEDSSVDCEPPFNAAEFEVLLQRECKLWQKKLRLQDWNVKVSLCRLHEMPDRDCLGFIAPVLDRKDAHMSLLSPLDVMLLPNQFIGGEEINYGLTLVHELLHLHTWPFAQGLTEQETIAEEQAINAISRALVQSHAEHMKPLTAHVTPPKTAGHYL